MRISVFLFLFSFSFPVMAMTLPKEVSQGELVYGFLDPGERIYLKGFELKPNEEGIFVFGVGRRQTDPLVFTLEKGWFFSEKIIVPVKARIWSSEKINGVPQNTLTPSKEEKIRIAKEQKILDEAREKETSQTVPLCFIWPVQGRISSPFGKQRLYNGVVTGDHSGLDIAAPKGTPVKAIADGWIQLSENDLFYTGGTIFIEHGAGVFSGYSHLSKVNVPVGTFVKAGDIIGEVGATGRATGPHLHLTVTWRGVRVDPELLLEERCL